MELQDRVVLVTGGEQRPLVYLRRRGASYRSGVS